VDATTPLEGCEDNVGSLATRPLLCGQRGVAAVLVGIKRAARVSSGGVNGLSLALSGALHWNLGVVNMRLKGIVFGVVWALGGGWAARWTMVSAWMIGAWTILFSQLPLAWPWLRWVAVL
jgi:hypothetical protein